MNDLAPNDYEAFRKLAEEGTVVPVMRRVMADLLTPVAAYLKIQRHSPYSFLLESVEGGEKVARYSFLGFNPETIVRSRDGRVTVETAQGREETDEPMLTVLRRLTGQNIPVRLPDLPPFVCGAVGYMSYDAVRWFEKIPDAHANDLDLDDAVMMFFSRVLAFDHVRHQIHLIANVFTDGRTSNLEADYQRAIDDIDAFAAQLEDPIEPLPRSEAAYSPGSISAGTAGVFHPLPDFARANRSRSFRGQQRHRPSGGIFGKALDQRRSSFGRLHSSFE